MQNGGWVSFDDEYDADALKKAEVERLLEHHQYDGNPVVQRMKVGESLADIFDETLKQRTYGLRFLWRRRKEFNQQIRNFEDVISYDVDGLKRAYFLNPNGCAEGAAFYPAFLGYLLGSACTFPDQEPMGFIEHFKNPDFFNLGGAILLGGIFFTLYSSLIERASMHDTSRVREQCSYIDNVLGRI